jgi:outer membrane protein assembly factor BamE
MRFISLFLAITISLVLSSCAPYDFSRRYVQQGNLLPQDKIARLKVGMSKEDCAVLMGTSLHSPLFNNNRWDYVYTWRVGGNAPFVKRISLYFDNGGRLVRWN